MYTEFMCHIHATGQREAELLGGWCTCCGGLKVCRKNVSGTVETGSSNTCTLSDTWNFLLSLKVTKSSSCLAEEAE